jgi:hypothetical protein
MRLSALLVTLFLVGCSTPVPVKQKWPELPETMLKACPNLQTIDKDEVKLSEFLKIVIGNYTRYHECAELLTAWQEWYQAQKKIHGELNK